jgi:uncharacterized protein YegJ (DUF2314 family)
MGTYRWLNRRDDEPAKRNHPPGGALPAPLNKVAADRLPVAVVLLLQRPRALDASTLARTAGLTFGLEVSTGEVGGPAFVAGVSPYFLLRLRGRVLAVHNVACPYFRNLPAKAAELPERRLRKAVVRHRAWVSVELLHTDTGIIENPYRMLGQLAAALASPDCLAVCIPARQRLYAFDSSMLAKLRSPDPLGALRGLRRASVEGVKANDPRLLAAVREARRRWPEFVAAFEQRDSGQIFSVKIPLRQKGRTEYMWMSVSALENDMIYGRLDNEPVKVKHLRAGDRVRIPVSDLHDWIYTRGDFLAGGFTIAALANIPKRPKGL